MRTPLLLVSDRRAVNSRIHMADDSVDVADRIFSTSVSLQCSISLPPNTPLTIDNLGSIAKELDFPKMKELILKDVLDTFATDESASVQATLYLTLQKILTSCPAVKDASMQLPNKHYM